MKEQEMVETIRRINTFNALVSFGLCFTVIILGIAAMPNWFGWFAIIIGIALSAVALYTLIISEQFLAPKD